MHARCKICNEFAKDIEKPLYQCIECKNYYHGSCHRFEPKPRNNLNWACKGCVSKHASTQQISQRHHEPARQDRFVASSSRSTSSIHRLGPSSDSMNRASSISTASVASHESGTSNPYPRCSMRECKQLRSKDQIFCPDHLKHLPAISEMQGATHAPASINTMPPSTHSTLSTSIHRSVRDPIKKKLLSGDQGNRVSRKSGANPFQPTRPISKQAMPPVVEDWPQGQHALPTRPAMLSRDNDKPVIDEEPPRKRPRASPVLDAQSNYQASGVEQSHLETRSRAPISPPVRPPSSQHTVPSVFSGLDLAKQTQDNPPKMGLKLSSRKGPARKMASSILPASYDDSRHLQETGDVSSFELARERMGNMGMSQEKDREPPPSMASRNTASRWQPRDVQPNSFHRPTPAPDPKAKVLINGLKHFEPVEDKKSNGCNYPEEPRLFRDDSRKPVLQAAASQQQQIIKTPERRTFEELRFRPGMSKPVAPLQHPRYTNSAGDTKQDSFDALFYRQVDIAATSLRGDLASPAISADARTAEPLPPDEPLFMGIDPRIHWPQTHPEEWFEDKAEEIKARGGRKANFGKAAQRLKLQRLKAEPVPFEETLPEKIATNPAWVRMLKMLDGVEESGGMGEKTSAGKGRRVMGKRQGSDRANGTVNGHVNGYANGVNGMGLNTKS